MNKCECKSSKNVVDKFFNEVSCFPYSPYRRSFLNGANIKCKQMVRNCKSVLSGHEIVLPKGVEIPDDYETCWECGYDHEYEPDYARRYHLAHQECNPRQ
jgi:hypothetical protein